MKVRLSRKSSLQNTKLADPYLAIVGVRIRYQLKLAGAEDIDIENINMKRVRENIWETNSFPTKVPSMGIYWERVRG